MPILLLIGAGVFAGYAFSNQTNATVSLVEGMVGGAILGVAAVTIYYAYKKI